MSEKIIQFVKQTGETKLTIGGFVIGMLLGAIFLGISFKSAKRNDENLQEEEDAVESEEQDGY